MKCNRLMIKLKTLLKEEILNDKITIEDIEDQLHHVYSRDEKRHLELLIDWYYDNEEHKQMVIDYLEVLNKVLQIGFEIVKKLNIPNFSIGIFKQSLLTQEEYSYDIASFFPIALYVSSSPEDEYTVGILVDQNGKVLELFEGSDEATPETTNMVNKLLNPNGKKVRIYACHDTKLVFIIDETGYLPKDLFVSPKKEVAAGYMDLKGERSLFSGIIDINDIAQVSDIDWKTIDKTRIEKFKWL